MPVLLKLRWIRTRKRLVIGHGDRLSEADHVRPFFRRNQAKFALCLEIATLKKKNPEFVTLTCQIAIKYRDERYRTVLVCQDS